MPTDIGYSAGWAISAGVLATLVMTAMMYMGFFMLPKQMPMDILYMIGSMMNPGKLPAYMMGTMGHASMGIAFALAHVGLFTAFDLNDNLWAWGLLFGAVHWAIMGMMFGMMKFMHPRIIDGSLDDPGPFVIKYPMMTVMGFLMVHLVYGLLVGVLYEAFAG